MTAHNNAKVGDIAKIVLMPGDPLRAKYIAETYLDNVKQFNTIRNMFGYTGYYKNVEVSVMGSGMGIPSMGIYSFELFKYYNVECIIRIGSSGAYTDKLELFDVVLAKESWSESTYALVQNNVKDDTISASEEINDVILKTASRMKKNITVDRIHTSDVFYRSTGIDECNEFYHNKGCCCVDMETFALFHNAKLFDRKAACLLTISDSIVKKQGATAEERQIAFNDMIQIALESVVSISEL